MSYSMVRAAEKAYVNANYLVALDLYRKLAGQLGKKNFEVNIRLCEKKIANISKNIKRANHLFYKKGNLTEVLNIFDGLLDQKVVLDKQQRDLYSFVKGIYRLRNGWDVPPVQPNAGFFTKNKRILYCLHQSVPHTTNGYSTRAHGIASGLQDFGWKVYATTRSGFPYDVGGKDLNKGYHECNVGNITYTAVAGWSLNKTPLDQYLAQVADHFFREAQTKGAEIIVAASNHITALPALVAARRLGLPFVYEVRGLWEITQASVEPQWDNSERFKVMRHLETQVASEADFLITLTSELADELVDRGVDRRKIAIVPNAADTEIFQPCEPSPAIQDKLRLESGVPVIGYAGSAVAYEGLDLLLEALANLTRKSIDYIFILVGDGKVLEFIKAQAKTLGIEQQCRFVGRVPFDEIPVYLSCMDIMPIPRLSSKVTEMVSPLKPLEAMAMGKTVVLSDVSPHKTLAGNNERAYLFEKDNATALTNVLMFLIENPEKRLQAGQAASKWIRKERTWKAVTNAYNKVLSGVKDTLKISNLNDSLKHIKLKDVTLGVIADHFTTSTLASAVRILPLAPDSWQYLLEHHKVDAIFVESAWKGNGGQWHRKVGYYSDGEFQALSNLLSYCRKRNIPSLFWNKEDPVHFERFRKAASLCDHVFTTDSRRIIPYLRGLNVLTKTVSSLPFYASPKIHNLLPSTRKWNHTVAYGGTYYGKRYPDRTEWMDKIMSAAAPLGLTIYDRQHSDPESPYKYPAGLETYVAGHLDYEDMIQAYKAHPVQVNVNSVLDSPTMFSRRVMEIAACGTPIISGPAMGMNRYLEGQAFIIENESEASQTIDDLLNCPSYRWRTAITGARSVMRAHTTELRLTQMLRTAGIVIEAPSIPVLGLIVVEMTESAAKKIVSQSLLPKCIQAKKWQGRAKRILESHDIQCDIKKSIVPDAWLLAQTSAGLEMIETEDFEDLAWTLHYSPYIVCGFDRSGRLADGAWSGVTTVDVGVDESLLLVKSHLNDYNTLVQLTKDEQKLVLRKPLAEISQRPNVPSKKKLLIAGHDLKFIKPFYSYFSKANFHIMLDFWESHTKHNEVISKRLLTQADVIFCEWMLGNAIWYAKNKKKDQKLIGRFHAQELRSPFFDNVPFHNFNKVMFVGPHMLRKAKMRNSSLQKNGLVIYNGVDVKILQEQRKQREGDKTLGFVGIVPQNKRLDKALDILTELRKNDRSYILRVKGKRPEDYPWMHNRTEEMNWYKEQYQRIENDPLLQDAVFFDLHGNDMPEWYANIDFVLSTSDFESFHFTIADGAAAGCIPIILPWEGADEIYPKEWVVKDVSEAVDRIKLGRDAYNIDEISNVSFKSFSIDRISEKMISTMQ